jgi:hypothetical protein
LSFKDESTAWNVYDAMIRFFFKEKPETLTDEEYAGRIKELRWLAENGFLQGIRL